MTNNIIDARELFMGKILLNTLDAMIEKHADVYHSYYLLIEEDGEDFIELRLHDMNADMHIVIDRAPILTYEGRYKNGQALFEIG
jgi:hypothetical protein